MFEIAEYRKNKSPLSKEKGIEEVNVVFKLVRVVFAQTKVAAVIALSDGFFGRIEMHLVSWVDDRCPLAFWR
ncbi:MAG: hypothetical protein PHI66_03245 [Candidatus Pacebacteria bacterium]|nr:hypothetical protein [Candidatus Paceibacterota bacterium]